MNLRRGFTLAEMAIVVVLIGIAMSMGLKMTTAAMENAAYSETKAKQERIKTALTAYLRTNGRLPCPDTAAPPTGTEPAACATPALGYGVVPWIALNLPRDTVQDGWGNFFTYRVANDGALIPIAFVPPASPPLHKNANQNWTIKAGVGAFDIASFSNATASPGYQSLRINSDGVGTAESLTAVAVIISHGKNGFGAQTVKGAARIPTVGAGADEITNATVGQTTFIHRAYVEGDFDDLVAYMTPQDLLQPLVIEGTLKPCRSYCSQVGTVSGVDVAVPPVAGCAPTAVPIPIGATPAACP